MYDAWIAEPGWSDLYTAGYKFEGYASVKQVKALQNSLVEKTQDQKLDDRAYNHIIGDVVATEGKWSAETETLEGETETNPINPNSIGVVKNERGAEAEEVWLLYWKPGAENNNPEAGDNELSLTLLDESNGEPKDLGGPGNIPTGQMKLQIYENDYSSNDRISLPAEAKFIVEHVGVWSTNKTYTNATVSFVDGNGEQVSLAVEDMSITKTVGGYEMGDFIFELEGVLQGGVYTFYKFADSGVDDEWVDTSVETPISVSVSDGESDEAFSGTLILHENGTFFSVTGEIGGTVFAPLGLPDKNGNHAGVVNYSDIVGFFEALLHGAEPELDELSLLGLDFVGRVGPFILAETTSATFVADSEALRSLISGEPPSAGTEIPLRIMFFDDWKNLVPEVKAFVSYTPGAITLVPPDPEGEKTSRQFGVVLDGPTQGTVKFQGAETITDVSINSEATRTVLRVTEPVRNVFAVEKEAEKTEVSDEEGTV